MFSVNGATYYSDEDITCMLFALVLMGYDIDSPCFRAMTLGELAEITRSVITAGLMQGAHA